MSEVSLSLTGSLEESDVLALSVLQPSPLTQSPRSLLDGSTLVDSDADDESELQGDTEQPLDPVQTVTRIAEQISMLQAKLERLDTLCAKFSELAWFDEDDVELVRKEHESTKLKLDAIKASVQRGDVVYMHVTLQRRELFLETAVRQHLVDVDKDYALFHALVKKQVYLTRLANNRVHMQQ